MHKKRSSSTGTRNYFDRMYTSPNIQDKYTFFWKICQIKGVMYMEKYVVEELVIKCMENICKYYNFEYNVIEEYLNNNN